MKSVGGSNFEDGSDWHFRKLQVGEKTREPIQGEFFATNEIRNATEALVREAIQNSLDAALKDNGGPKTAIRVRFFLSSGKHALTSNSAKLYFDGGRNHFRATGNGLRAPPDLSEPCPFLVVEDFNTTGLQGDPAQWEPLDLPNAFFHFFRAEGRSSKSETDRGRWGIGKYVFPRSSRISSLFGLTIRADDHKRLLMGQAVLKSHRLEGATYCPDGFFGVKQDNGLVSPSRESEIIDRFCGDFGLTRRDEPGLSIVVPWIFDEDMTEESLVEAVVRGYFHPILTGSLVVTVATPESSREINKATLVDAALSLGDKASREILPLVDLSEWASTRNPGEIIRLNPANHDRPDWSQDLIPVERLEPMRCVLKTGQRLGVRAPLTVREKDKPETPSHFDFFMRQDDSESGRTVFIREGIIISDVRSPRIHGVCSIVVIEDKPIATLLGDSENPAHTQWQKDSSHFKGKYTYGTSCLDFVTRSVSMLVRYLNEKDADADPELLKHVFSLPKLMEQEKPPQRSDPQPPKKRDTPKESTEIPPIPEPKKRRFSLHKVSGGFSVTRGAGGAKIPGRLIIEVAYDRRRGNPLKKYDLADFRLEMKPIRLEPPPQGLKIVEQKRNRLVAEVERPDFQLTVTGFDEQRDLFVDVEAEDKGDDTET